MCAATRERRELNYIYAQVVNEFSIVAKHVKLHTYLCIKSIARDFRYMTVSRVKHRFIGMKMKKKQTLLHRIGGR